MALPKTVQRQLEQAEALEAQRAQAQQQAEQRQTVDDVSQLAASPSEPPAPAPAPVAAQPQPAAPAPAPEPAPPTDDWQQKYRTLQGMFQRQVPELQARTKQLESQLTAAMDKLSSLQSAKPATPAEPPKAEIEPRDARAFGEDMVEMVNRYAQRTFAAAQQRFDAMYGTLEQRLAAVEKAVTGVSQKTDSSMESTFYATLEQLVPDWRSINASQEWLDWLEQIDPIYNLPKQAALDVAFERRDAARVATVFKEFLKSRPTKKVEAPPITPSEGGGAPQTPSAPAAKPILSQKAVQAFYLDVARGRYRGREAEAARHEAEINQAAAEGRIV